MRCNCRSSHLVPRALDFKFHGTCFEWLSVAFSLHEIGCNYSIERCGQAQMRPEPRADVKPSGWWDEEAAVAVVAESFGQSAWLAVVLMCD